MRMLLTVIVIAWALQGGNAQAQKGRLLREGLEYAGKKFFGKAASETTQEGAEQVLKKGASVAVRKAGQESVEAAAKRTGIAAIHYSDIAASAVTKHGSAIAAPLVNRFGADGAKALTKLSPTQARRMAMLADDFATGGRGSGWMKVLAEKGDVAADWIWKNKGTVGLATAATAFLANPEPFLMAGESVATTGIKTAGEHVARPVIEQTVATVTPQMAKAVSESSARHPWLLPVAAALLLGVIVHVGRRIFLRR